MANGRTRTLPSPAENTKHNAKHAADPAIAPRLEWVRNQLARHANAAERISDRLVVPDSGKGDATAGPQIDHDVIGVLGDIEALANRLGELLSCIEANVGMVGANEEAVGG